MKEEALLTGPLEYTNEPYAIAKIAGLKMCESYNLQYGTNYIAVMPTNLYGPNDNFDLEKSHVLPAMIRKIHLGHCLLQGDWTALRKDLDRLPVEGVSGQSDQCDILDKLAKYGIHDSFVELWGTGKPLREFLWSEEMADASVFIMEKVDFADLKGINPEVQGRRYPSARQLNLLPKGWAIKERSVLMPTSPTVRCGSLPMYPNLMPWDGVIR